MTNQIVLELLPMIPFGIGVVLYPKEDDKRTIIAMGIALVLIFALVSAVFAFQKRAKIISMPILRIVALVMIGVGFFGSISSFFSNEALPFRLFSFSLFSQLLVRVIAEYKKLD